MPAALHDVQLGIGCQTCDPTAIDLRHDLVLIAHHDQGFGLQEGQEPRTRPAHHTGQLLHIAHGRGW